MSAAVIEVRISKITMLDAASAQQAKFHAWQAMCTAGIPLPAFSVMRSSDEQFKARTGTLVRYDEGVEYLFQWSA